MKAANDNIRHNGNNGTAKGEGVARQADVRGYSHFVAQEEHGERSAWWWDGTFSGQAVVCQAVSKRPIRIYVDNRRTGRGNGSQPA